MKETTNMIKRKKMAIYEPKKKKNSVYKAQGSTKTILLMVIIVSLLCLNLVSAELKSFDKNIGKFGEITVKSNFLFVPTGDLAKYKLEDVYTSVLEIRETGTATLYENGRLFSAKELKDTSGKLIDISSSHIYLLSTIEKTEDIPTYDTICEKLKDAKNGTEYNSCTQKLTGTKKETKITYEWNKYLGDELPAGDYTWKIEGKRPLNTDVDLILTSGFGDTKLDEWAWHKTSFTERKEVTITGGSGTLSNFTVYLNVTYDSDMQVDFEDLRFVSGACTSTQTDELKFEFDAIVNSTSAGVWVKIPSLTTGSNSICMYYSNPTAVSGEDGVNAWDINYVGVFHFNEGTGTTTRDSITQYNFSFGGTTPPIWNNSLVFGKALSFRNGGGVILNASNTLVDITTRGMTLESWFYDSGGVGRRDILSGLDNGYGYGFDTTNYRIGHNGVSSQTDGARTADKLQQYSVTDDGSTVHYYINKSDQGTDAMVTGVFTSTDYVIGAYGDLSGEYMLGMIDELKVSNTTRSYIWLNRSYDNSDVTLFTFGAEETVSTNFTENSITYSTPVLQLSNQNYYLNATYNGTLSYLYSYFYYNNTNQGYAITQSNLNNELILKSSYVISSTFTGSKTFFWQVYFSDGSGNIYAFNSSTITQSINTLGVGNCSVYNVSLINYFLKDEQTQNSLNGTIDINLQIYPVGSTTNSINFSQTFGVISNITNLSTTSNASICLQNVLNNSQYSLYVQVRYYSPSYVTRHNYIQGLLITNTNTPQNVNLYHLLSASATEFVITYKNKYYQAVPEVLINIQRKYIAEDVYKTVQIEKTDTDGTVIGYFDLINNGIYAISVTKEGILLDTFTPITLYCITGQTCSINLNELLPSISPNDFERSGNVNQNINQNSTSRNVTITFSTSDNSVSNFTMIILKKDMWENVTICSNSLTTSAGSLRCHVPNSYGNSSFIINFYQDGNRIALDYGSFATKATDVLAGNTVVLLLVLLLTIPMMFLPSLIWTLIGGIIAIVISIILLGVGGFGLSAGTFLGWLLVAGFILVWKLNKQGQL